VQALECAEAMQFRKSKGKTLGRPPFGTARNEQGYLIPTKKGAWLLPNGRYIEGTAGAPPPVEGAIWRGYWECLQEILTTYIETPIGIALIARRLNEAGWAFCDRRDKPRKITRGDVRRVVANWPEYGGAVLDRSSKDRPAYETIDFDDIPLRADRAVLPLDMLKKVATVRRQRSLFPQRYGPESDGRRTYLLTSLIYCAHCADHAHREENPDLESRLTGRAEADGTLRYVHRPGLTCGSSNRSNFRWELDKQAQGLVALLAVDRQTLAAMTRQVLSSLPPDAPDSDDNFEARRQEAIEDATRRIEATIHLYAEGRLSREEYLTRMGTLERSKRAWENRQPLTTRVTQELAECHATLENLTSMLRSDSGVQRCKVLIRQVFARLTVNLDARRIVSFRVNPWFVRYFTARVALLREEYANKVAQKKTVMHTLEHNSLMPHRGLFAQGFRTSHSGEAGRCGSATLAEMDYDIRLMYWGSPLPQMPISERIL